MILGLAPRRGLRPRLGRHGAGDLPGRHEVFTDLGVRRPLVLLDATYWTALPVVDQLRGLPHPLAAR